MAVEKVLDHFVRVDLQDPVDAVIEQIRGLLQSGSLKPADRLPSQKKIEERTGIPRGAISKALRRLETYGILKTVPQSGTYVAAIGLDALEGLLANVLKLEESDFESMVDTRCVLEVYAIEQVIAHASDEEVRELERVHEAIAEKIRSGVTGFDEDMVFHLKIAEYSKNPILKSILTLLVSDIIHVFQDIEKRIGVQKVFGRLNAAIEEHQRMVQAIKARDSGEARKAMRAHFEISKQFRRGLEE